MNALVIEYATCMNVVQVHCSKCGASIVKQPAKQIPRKRCGQSTETKYNYCPVCGCFIDAEGYPAELEHTGAVGC